MSDRKIVVITGASRGLGLAIVQEFVTSEWEVFGTGRSDKPADFPEGAAYHKFDASDADACESFWKELHAQNPDAEVCLVNNAGAYVSGALGETSAEDYDRQMKGIYFTSVYMTKALSAVFPQARIINVISNSALAAHNGNSAYGAAKTAQMFFFQSLQDEFAPSKYQITNLYPSDIASHGPNPEAIDPKDLAAFIREQAENSATYYLRDVTVYPR